METTMTAELEELKEQRADLRALRDEYSERLTEATRELGRALLDGDEDALRRIRAERARIREGIEDIYAVLPILDGRVRELGA